jgi:predicted small lipoprotein YifL
MIEILQTMHDQRPSRKNGAGALRERQGCIVLWSILLLLCVSALASCGATPPATIAPAQKLQPTQAAQPFHAAVRTLDGDFTVSLAITPNRSGTNVFKVHVLDTHTDKPATHAKITLYTTMQDMPMGTDSILLHTDGRGLFSATGDNLSMGGHWAIGITLQLSDHSIHKAGVNLVTPS